MLGCLSFAVMLLTVETSEFSNKRELSTVERKVLDLFALVNDGIQGATSALLSGDRERISELVSRENMIDDLYSEIEALALDRIASTDVSFKRLQRLITVLRMLPEIERSGDLAEHIAWRSRRGLESEMGPRIRGIIQRMGELLEAMWSRTARAFENLEDCADQEVDELDDELDELHVGLTAEIVSGNFAVPVAIEMAMIGRFYERLGDHAVNLCRRISTVSRMENQMFNSSSN